MHPPVPSLTDTTLVADLNARLRDVPDFPKPGIVFKDITPVLADPRLFGRVIDAMSAPFRGQHVTKVVGVEARGFLLGAPIALALNAGFVPARKPGKLPHRSVVERYSLEYGSDGVEMHEDAILQGERVLVVDDVLATGGTAEATARLVSRLGGELVGFCFLLSLDFLEGPNRLGRERVTTLLTF
ncbi:adenine phosphoribosyltransferase [Myxococcus xanthus DK 1622]|uniref:Adenine phosphoribosyltransferase n=1 Tax=Myxococcus xanthus (strain DK1622) TaxID=246197 RepID=APT_MYXXD|nr:MULTISPECIES: adenine phosphoribosyltransferase [Myxococcus]Q1D1H1.1 RecName: Full=Adenine phosphoribosyltransferase; Short=APRT [Myxococcus xanthus DK 1622]ABF91841.1 adenine phosphoribosyltransferase [Myxococcus xanthus DK 1622]NOJ54746.1 adenine phosphoribosyltransferase [Myxococcus xanthus]QPM77823.1 adenine phosphoribosyltransferase [Myxococcus xanthus]QVW66891.1 adenine phosphoribosyltransferase [Myxococcus xanthus DZ2]QZZ53008.1 Adenine phosphoribosyltransferase [Myxococcus xanthus]